MVVTPAAIEMAGTINIIRQPIPRQMACGPSCLGGSLFRDELVYLPMKYLLSLYFARIFNCFNDLVISGTTAEISSNGLLDLVMVWIRFSSSSIAPDMRKPGVQYPHWTALSLMNAD